MQIVVQILNQLLKNQPVKTVQGNLSNPPFIISGFFILKPQSPVNFQL